ncbi:MAG: D-alanyl-D-alanine carboxypeptidase/D-alanyl-D-alanine-endopeptidase [Caryophanon sp.]|nr:D-alanyl-D-alanine carboxypeptidase/D-alanyl-D-alanine-endopeptidase [Caryophanon sp.]
MKKIIALCMSVLLVVATMAPAASANTAQLTKTVQAQMKGVQATIAVRDLDTNTLVYGYNQNLALAPASNMKLLTAAAALHHLGTDYEMTTDLYIDGTIEGNTLNGNVYVRGEGDPTFQADDFITFANALKAKGITQINGHFYGDESWFTGPRLAPGIGRTDELQYYGAQISALTMSPNNDYDASTMIVSATGSSVGKAPTLTYMPNSSGMNIVNQAKTVAKGKANTLSIKRQYNTNRIIVSGSIPVGATKREWMTLYSPTLNTLVAMKQVWEMQGVTFIKGSQQTYAKVPKHAELIHSVKSIPMDDIVYMMNKLSNNSIADILVKTLGRVVKGEGSNTAGAAVLTEYAKSIGLNMNNVRAVDGSGMSLNNRFTANELTRLLISSNRSSWYRTTFLPSLPQAAHYDRLMGGTLRSRLTSIPNRVMAKTGTHTGVNALSGYLRGKSGEWYAFSVVTKNGSAARIDRVVVEMYRQL